MVSDGASTVRRERERERGVGLGFGEGGGSVHMCTPRDKTNNEILKKRYKEETRKQKNNLY